MKNIAIVVAAYNRPKSLLRLLKSINNADYNQKKPDLIISLDYNQNKDCFEIAKKFNYLFGEKIIIQHEKQLGLKAHILSCGDLTQNYDAIVVLEDDLYVSPAFFDYSHQALKKYNADENIAGISLYKFEWNQHAMAPFAPFQNGKDAFFIQCAQSWGQLFSKQMWQKFRQWLEKNEDAFEGENVSKANLPENINFAWPNKSSWLKYFTRYVVENKKYFVFPYSSFSTNFCDVGEHANVSKTAYQVEMLFQKKTFDFPDLNEEAIKYNVFLENEALYKFLKMKNDELCVDLYGIQKPKENQRYWLSCSVANYRILQSFGRSLRPHDANIIFEISGEDFFLYDTLRSTRKIKTTKQICQIRKRKIEYSIKEIYWKELVFISKIQIKAGLKRVIKKI